MYSYYKVLSKLKDKLKWSHSIYIYNMSHCSTECKRLKMSAGWINQAPNTVQVNTMWYVIYITLVRKHFPNKINRNVPLIIIINLMNRMWEEWKMMDSSKLKTLSACVLNRLQNAFTPRFRGYINQLSVVGIRFPWPCFSALIPVGYYWSRSWRSRTRSWRCCERTSHWRWTLWTGCQLPASQQPLWRSRMWPYGHLHTAASRRTHWSPCDWPCTDSSGFEGSGWTWALDPRRIPQGRRDSSEKLAWIRLETWGDSQECWRRTDVMMMMGLEVEID